MFTIVTMVIILLASIFAIIAVFTKTIFTKILYINASSSLVILFICFLSSAQYKSSYIDIAIIYGLLGNVGSALYLKYFNEKKNTLLANK